MDTQDRISHEDMLRRAVLGGDELAWRQLYDAAFDRLHDYVAWRLGGSRDQADEVVQETWLLAIRKMRGFDPRKGSFIAWMRGLAVNVLRHHLRTRQRIRKREQSHEGNGSRSPRTEEIERAERIAAALDAMPDLDEQVLRAKYLEGLSVGEIAAQWNETPKAIESRLTRARDKFRNIYERND
jgi:RNA polymerase sigma-70 factor (ECF subfamily)